VQMVQIAVLRLVREAQLQHGLRHDDYQRYRYAQNVMNFKEAMQCTA